MNQSHRTENSKVDYEISYLWARGPHRAIRRVGPVNVLKDESAAPCTPPSDKELVASIRQCP